MIPQTSADVSSQRKRHSTTSKGPSSATKYSINNVRQTHNPSLITTPHVPVELGPRNRRYQNIAWVRGQHPVATNQSYQPLSINTANPAKIGLRSLKDNQRQHRLRAPHPTSMSVRPIYNPNVYRINRIKPPPPPPTTTSTSQTITDNPSAIEPRSVQDSEPPTLGKFKWLSS